MAFQPIYAIRDRRGRGTLLPYNQRQQEPVQVFTDVYTGLGAAGGAYTDVLDGQNASYSSFTDQINGGSGTN